jgi:hypothetical protein
MTLNETTDNIHKIEFVAAAAAYALLYNLYSLKRERYGHSENYCSHTAFYIMFYMSMLYA